MFSKFARMMSSYLGNSLAFAIAVIFVFVWFITGPIFDFSNAWQLVINTSTTIMTFLMVFLLQNTQNRDTIAVHLKLDEMIRSMKGAHNELLKVEQLSDEELQDLLHRYENLAFSVRNQMKKGKKDTDIPKI